MKPERLSLIDVIASPLAFTEAALFKPHPRQADVLMSTHPVRVIVSGRRGGKTRVQAALAAWRSVKAIVTGKPHTTIVVAPSLDQAKIVIAFVDSMLSGNPQLAPLITKRRDSPWPELHLAGGRVSIIVRSVSEQGRHIRGRGAGLIIIDEVSSLHDAEPLISEVLMPLMAEHSDGVLSMSSTGDVEGSFLWRMVQRAEAGDPRIACFRWGSLENPALATNRDFVEAQRRELSDSTFRAEWGGEFASVKRSLFRWSDIERALVGHGGRDAHGSEYVVGWDPASRRDRSGVVVLRATNPAEVVLVDDIAGDDYVRQVSTIVQLGERFGDALIAFDQTGVGQPLGDALKARGAWARGVVFTSATKHRLMTNLAIALEQGDLKITDRRLVEELRDFTVRRSKSRDSLKYEAGPGATDDLVSALAIAFDAIRAMNASRELPTMQGSVSTAPWFDHEIGVLSAEDDSRLDALRGIAPPGTIELGRDGIPTSFWGNDGW